MLSWSLILFRLLFAVSSCSGMFEFTSGCCRLYPLVSNCSTLLSGCCFHHVFGSVALLYY